MDVADSVAVAAVLVASVVSPKTIGLHGMQSATYIGFPGFGTLLDLLESQLIYICPGELIKFFF